MEITFCSGTDGPDTAEFARARACGAAGENMSRTRGRFGGRFLRYDGSNYDAGVPPASFGVVGSQGPPFSVTQTTSIPQQLPPPEHAVASAAPAASYKSRLRLSYERGCQGKNILPAPLEDAGVVTCIQPDLI